MSAPRTLFVSTFSPTLGSGRALRTYTCVRALATLGPVDLAYVDYDGCGPSPEYRAIENLSFHRINSSRGIRRAARFAAECLRGVPPSCCKSTSPELIAAVRALLAQPGRGRIVAGEMDAATVLLRTARTHPFIYNAHNVESEYVERDVRLRSFALAHMRRHERRLLTLASESWMVSRGDVRAAQALVPSARVRYVPNAVDVSAIQPCTASAGAGPGGAPTLMMVGDFQYPPNRSGLRFMVDSVLPLIWRSQPDARLRVVGRGLEGWEAPDARVELAGFVEDLASCYAQARCVVVPLTEGAGTPLKFVEALAYGVPIVATPFAARGLEAIPDVHFRCGPDPEKFAAAAVEVLRGGGLEMAAEARRLAERAYSIEALAEAIAA